MTDIETRGPAVQARRYAGAEDLALLRRFASRATAARSPLRAHWHPGDFTWQLKGAVDQPQRMRLWEGPDGIEAVAWIVGPGELWFEATPDSDHLIADAIGWLEQRWRTRPDDRAKALSVPVAVGDTRRMAALEALGYAKGAPSGVGFELDLG